MSNKDLQILLTDCTPEQLVKYYEGLATPGKIDRVGIEQFLLNVPLNVRLVFPFVTCWMRQNRYSPMDLKQISQAISFVINKTKQPVSNVLKHRVTMQEKDLAGIAFRRILIANRILYEAIAEPVLIDLRGSEYDYAIEEGTSYAET